jgi:hypothetical protein
MSDFPAFGKIPRYFREVIITEKIDGTNGLVQVELRTFGEGAGEVPDGVSVVIPQGMALDETGMPLHELWVRAGSRKRWINPQDDNHGFARWVADNAYDLGRVLGPGRHYGEWWGAGIQRRYGLDHKRFSLFNTSRWNSNNLFLAKAPAYLDVVPVLGRGYDSADVYFALDQLRAGGSAAAPGFMQPEGVIVYHTAGGTYSKATLDNDGLPKSVAA